MVKDVIKVPEILRQKSYPATAEDLPAVLDLLDTFRENHDTCHAMAANMIGVLRRIIVFDTGIQDVVMLNPEIIRHSQPYITCEKCVCSDQPRRVVRYKTIRVKFQDVLFNTHRRTYTGYTAKIIQHVIDHCNGILI